MLKCDREIINLCIKTLIVIGVFGSVSGCKTSDKKGPNIGKVKLEIRVEHFENDFFALDTNQLKPGLDSLKAKYGYFFDDFLFNIAAFSTDETQIPVQIREFLRANRYIYDSVDQLLPHLNKHIKKIENAFKRVKVYFPGCTVPNKVITYIGPIDGYGSFVSKSGLCVGLQQFLGESFSGYSRQANYLESLFGKQRLRQFTPEYIAPIAILHWINRKFPDKAGHFTLGEKLLEEGRKIYLLKALLPHLPDARVFGYTKDQLTWCHNNNILIKRYFAHEKLLKTKRPEKIVTYLSDNLRPEGLPKEFPDNIGKYLGFLMVREFMEAHKNTSLPELMKLEFWQLKS